MGARELRQLAVVLKGALASRDRSFVYAENQALGEMKRTLREERFHAHQRSLLGFGSDPEEDHVDTDALFGNPLAQTARENLLDIGYPDHPDVLAAEIGAKIAAGSWDELGLSTSQRK